MNEITILSGKGGTGKTSISAAFATLDNHATVADCDVDAANLYLILQPQNYRDENFVTGFKAIIDNNKCSQCGVCAELCRFDAIHCVDGQYTITENDCDGCKLCSRLCPSEAITMMPNDKSRWFIGNYRNGVMIHARLAPGEENSGKLVSVVRDQARTVAEENKCNTIIIDGPPGTGCPVISSVTGAKLAVIVTEPSRSGFHDLKRIIELTSNFSIQNGVIVNKHDLNPGMTQQIVRWCNEMGIPVLGQLPFDAQVVTAMVNCKSITEWMPDAPVSIEIKRIWNNVKLMLQ